MTSNETPAVDPTSTAVTGDQVIPNLSANDEEQKSKQFSGPEGDVSWKYLFRVYSYGTKLDYLFLAIATVTSIGAGVTLPLMNIVFGNLVGDFNDYFVPGSTISEDHFNSSINRNTLYIVYLFIAKFGCSYISMFVYRMVSIRLSAALRLDYLRHLFAQSISTMDKLPPGGAASTITSAANTVQIGISEKVSTCLQFTALLISAYVVAFKYSWQLTLVTSSILLFVCIIYGTIVPIWMKFQKSIDHANGKASAIASETFNAIRMVVACGAEQRVAMRFKDWVEEARRRGLKMSPLTSLQLSPIFFGMFADFALTFWFGVRLYMWQDINSVGTVLIVLMSVIMSLMSIGNIVAPLTAASKAATAASMFFEMIDKPVTDRTGLKDPDVTASEDIRFQDVVFAYPSRAHVKVLDELNITFKKGKLTAIVGPSGSGKSTVVGLIERWYDLSAEENTSETAPIKSKKSAKKSKSKSSKKVSTQDSSEGSAAAISPAEEEKLPIPLSGTISIGPHNLKDIDMKWWRSQIGLVQQEPFIFNDTIFVNVAYGLVGSIYEHEDEGTKRKLVEEACREAFADEFISRLPLGYETTVGESGIKLSGGQRQRIAIARSIVKRPQILIFDEATSSIDVRGERIVQAALDRAAQNRTTITIAHRLSTIKKADTIVVVAKGKVVEQGTHDELLSHEDGVYRNLVHAQQLTINDKETEALQLEPDFDSVIDEKEGGEKIYVELNETKDAVYRPRGLVRSFGLLLVEQKRHALWLGLTIVGALGAGSAIPVQAYLFAKVITVFQETGQALVQGSQYWSVRFVYLAIGVGVSYAIIGWASNSLSIHVSSTYRQQYFENIVTKPIRFFDSDENSAGTLVSRVSQDPTQLQELMGLNMAMLFIAGLTLVGAIIIAFVYGWKLTLVGLCAALPITLVAGFFRLRYELIFEEMNEAVFAESSQFAAEAFGAIRTVASLTLEDMICDRYSVLLQGHVKKAWRKAWGNTLAFALSDSINLLCMALTFWYGGRLLGSREYDPVQWLIIYIAVIQGSENAGQWASFGPNMAQAKAAANRILSMRIRDGRTSTVSANDLLQSEGGVEIALKDVHFQYPSREIPIFSGLSLTIQKGQFAALVGASGCGKSTIISLLEQFYQVQKGAITANGVNITDYDSHEYRKAISLVAQEATLFMGTLRENILLGVDENTVTDEQLVQACRDAEIHDFITSLPEGYNTDIGSKGVALSGGQKQRISIARALIRNPKVLLLDEATSSLDSEAEKLVQAAFERAGKGRTMIVVAHRLATVQNADVIFVLGSAGHGIGARVLEQGSHNDLVARRGIYWQMCLSQALDR